MDNFIPGFVETNTWTAFEADPIAGKNLQRRFAITLSPANPDLALLDVLTHRNFAYKVTKFITANDLRWALAYDDHDTKFVVIECLGKIDGISAVGDELRQMRYAELQHYDRSAADHFRHLHLPEG